jgi:hypothetical protein
MVKICQSPVRLLTKAICVPSGDHAGVVWYEPLVSC